MQKETKHSYGIYDNLTSNQREIFHEGKLVGFVSRNLIIVGAKTDEGFPGNKPFGYYPDVPQPYNPVPQPSPMHYGGDIPFYPLLIAAGIIIAGLLTLGAMVFLVSK